MNVDEINHNLWPLDQTSSKASQIDKNTYSYVLAQKHINNTQKLQHSTPKEGCEND